MTLVPLGNIPEWISASSTLTGVVTLIKFTSPFKGRRARQLERIQNHIVQRTLQDSTVPSTLYYRTVGAYYRGDKNIELPTNEQILAWSKEEYPEGDYYWNGQQKNNNFHLE